LPRNRARSVSPPEFLAEADVKDLQAPLPDTLASKEDAAMATPERIYRRTEAGRKAWDTQSPSVPLEYRRILGLIPAEAKIDSLRARLPYSETELEEILAELEQLGLVASEQDFTATDLDFTSNLSVADVVAEHNRRLEASRGGLHEDLDFTSSLKLSDLDAARKK
jgi:hypothetical protein